ncbi:unnamed protein product [Musa acuminata subsp. burmannicoides]
MDAGKQSSSTIWTREAVREYEVALVAYIEGHRIHVPWEKVAAYLPGRTVAEVKEHYDELVEGICRTHPYAMSLPYCHLPEDSAAGCSDGNMGSVVEPRRDQGEITSTAESNPGQGNDTSGDSVITDEHHPSEDDEQGQEAGSKAP